MLPPPASQMTRVKSSMQSSCELWSMPWTPVLILRMQPLQPGTDCRHLSVQASAEQNVVFFLSLRNMSQSVGALHATRMK